MTTAPILSAAAAAAGLLAVIAGPLAAQTGLLSPYTAFRTFALGTFLGSLLGVGLGLWALFRSWNQPEAVGRQWAWAGLLVGAALLLTMALAGASAAKVPPIHDVTTSPDDPPAFRHALDAEDNRGRDLSYPHGVPDTPERQREAYPDLQPVPLALAPDAAFSTVRGTAESLGWEILASDAAAGHLEATETSRLFRFVDDIVIRVRPDEAGTGSVVDLRSTSRKGVSDLGANAERLRRFRDALVDG